MLKGAFCELKKIFLKRTPRELYRIKCEQIFWFYICIKPCLIPSKCLCIGNVLVNSCYQFLTQFCITPITTCRKPQRTEEAEKLTRCPYCPNDVPESDLYCSQVRTLGKIPVIFTKFSTVPTVPMIF